MCTGALRRLPEAEGRSGKSSGCAPTSKRGRRARLGLSSPAAERRWERPHVDPHACLRVKAVSVRAWLATTVAMPTAMSTIHDACRPTSATAEGCEDQTGGDLSNILMGFSLPFRVILNRSPLARKEYVIATAPVPDRESAVQHTDRRLGRVPGDLA